MNDLIVPLFGVASVAVVGGVVVYIKLLKKRLRRYVLRYDKIKKYFDEGK